LDQILKMGCSNGKEGIWNQIRSGNPILVLIWIKPSVCVVQNLSVGLIKKQTNKQTNKRDYPDPNKGQDFKEDFRKKM